MEQITAEGLKVANDLAQRYGFSQDAVVHMMQAILRGRGCMAQFNHPEFAGSGQWMQGGMMMLGDMFNNALKARVDGLCQAISGILASQPNLLPVGSFQSQHQSGAGQQQQVATGLGQQMQVGGGQQQSSRGGQAPATGSTSLFVADPRDTWWPAELGTPNATGSQNDVHYAYFGDSGRLAVQVNGKVGVYDTGDHQIGGFSQQQSSGGGVVFSTPGGTVSLASLSAMPGTLQQGQSSAGGGQQQQSSRRTGGMQAMAPMAPMTPMSPMGFAPMRPFEAMTQQTWWPADLGSADATGSSNNLRYAYFAAPGRLAVDQDGSISLHDTRGQQITGVSQQGSGGDLVFSTPGGGVSLADLPVVTPGAPGEAVAAEPAPAQPLAAEADAIAPPVAPPEPTAAGRQGPTSDSNEVLAALERLGDLKAKGILTEAEFTAKKADLLSRL